MSRSSNLSLVKVFVLFSYFKKSVCVFFHVSRLHCFTVAPLGLEVDKNTLQRFLGHVNLTAVYLFGNQLQPWLIYTLIIKQVELNSLPRARVIVYHQSRHSFHFARPPPNLCQILIKQ